MFETINMTRYLIACGILFGCLAALYFGAILWQRYRLHGKLAPTKRRLRVVESLPLNARQKIIIIRQDDIDHTVILGGQSDLHLGSMSAPLDKNSDAIATQETTPATSRNSIGFLKPLPANEKPAKTNPDSKKPPKNKE